MWAGVDNYVSGVPIPAQFEGVDRSLGDQVVEASLV